MIVLVAVFISLASLAALLALIFIIRASVLRLQISDVTSKYVFITGCDTGFGNILARKLDASGVNIFAGCLTTNGARDLQSVTSSRLVTVQIDITNKESVAKAHEIVKSRLPSNTGENSTKPQYHMERDTIARNVITTSMAPLFLF